MNQITGRKLILIIDEWDAMFRECKGADEILDNYILLLRSLQEQSDRSTFCRRLHDGYSSNKKYGHESAVSDFYEYSMVEPRPLQEYIGFTTEEVKSLCQKYDKIIPLCRNGMMVIPLEVFTFIIEIGDGINFER